MCFFRGSGGTNAPFVFELLCLSPWLFIDSLFMYLLDSIYVFLDLCNSFFRGCCEACYLQSEGVFLRSRQEEKEVAKRMFQSKTKPKDCCYLRQREKVAGKL